MTGSGQGHWVASSKSTAEATLLAPVFYHGAPQGLSVRLPRFRCVRPRALPSLLLTTSLQPTLPEDQTSPHASLNSQTLVGLSEPSGSGWLQLLSGACAAHLKPSIHPPPATQLKSRARCGDHSTHVMGFLFNHAPQGTVGRSMKSD